MFFIALWSIGRYNDFVSLNLAFILLNPKLDEETWAEGMLVCICNTIDTLMSAGQQQYLNYFH